MTEFLLDTISQLASGFSNNPLAYALVCIISFFLVKAAI
jgi:hypothetical protein